jgi:hypothetical protein
MVEQADNQQEVVDPLRLDRCPNCGYPLTGLPDRGQCPECGSAYDREMIVLYGWPGLRLMSRTVEMVRGCPPSFSLMGPVVLVVTILGIVLPMGVQGLVVLAVAVLLTGGYFLWRRSGPPPMQLRLSRDGFSLRRGLGQVKLRPWSPAHCVQIIPPLQAVGGSAVRHWVRITAAEILGLPRPGNEIVEIAFDATPETAARIRQRLSEWGLRAV